jgi:hypothetical protein
VAAAPAVPGVSPGVSPRASPRASPGTPPPVDPPEARLYHARVIPLRRWAWPALAAAAALMLVLSPRVTPPTPTPKPRAVLHEPLPAGALASGANVVSVEVDGAKSSTVLEIEGSHPESTSAVVWIQDEPDDPTPEPAAVD